ncbi:hypothetical protein JL721_6401 [Aureococcus anophagefferens]|nr:hypothetical protein JL721_6401 [Aureococcus anophagefferens]
MGMAWLRLLALLAASLGSRDADRAARTLATLNVTWLEESVARGERFLLRAATAPRRRTSAGCCVRCSGRSATRRTGASPSRRSAATAAPRTAAATPRRPSRRLAAGGAPGGAAYAAATPRRPSRASSPAAASPARRRCCASRGWQARRAPPRRWRSSSRARLRPDRGDTAHVYVSSPGAAALANHTDVTDVLVVQLRGSKTWRVCGRAQAAFTHGELDAARLRRLEMAAVADCEATTLSPGDALYVPRRSIHSARATDDAPSTHLTLGLAAPCADRAPAAPTASAGGAGGSPAVGAATCEYCAPGSYSLAGASQCESCAAGRYAFAGSPSCSDCPAGSYADEAGASICAVCDPGRFNNAGGTTCYDCPPHTYAPLAGADDCARCPDGASSYGGAVACTCPAGEYVDEDADACAPCPSGRFSDTEDSDTECAPCAAGSHANDEGATACDACGAGTWAPVAGLSSCFDCDAGSSSAAGASSCEACLPNTFAAAAGDLCEACDANWMSHAGATECFPDPTACPSSAPTAAPSGAPTAAPSASPTARPSTGPSPWPTLSPTTSEPSLPPSPAPSAVPAAVPTPAPTSAPSPGPSSEPSAAPSATPSAAPSPAPSAIPTPRPTPYPTTAEPSPSPTLLPSPQPSSFPTVYPQVTALPAERGVALTKPASANFTLFLINLSQDELPEQCIRNTTGEPDRDHAGAAVFPEVAWSRTRLTLGNSIDDLDATVVATIRSAGSTPGTYTFRYAVDACVSNVGDGDVRLVVEIRTEPVASESYVELGSSAPVLGEDWRAAATIVPVDADGDRVAAEDIDEASVFEAVLSKQKAQTSENETVQYLGYQFCTTTTKTFPEGAALVADCATPDAREAGVWDLHVSSTARRWPLNVSALCPAGRYDAAGYCEDCFGGLTCDEPGVTLDVLPLKAGRWRGSPASTNVRKCLNPTACRGGNATGDASCRRGYEGPLCAVCDAGYAPAGIYRCEACTPEYTRTVLAAPACVLLLVALCAYLFVYHKAYIEGLVFGSMTKRRYQSLKVKAKILFVMEQITIFVPENLPSVALPTSYLKYLDVAQVLNLDAARNAERMCITPPNFYTQLITVTAIPIAACSALLFMVAQLKLRKRRWEGAYTLLLLLTFCVFPTVSQTIFQTFSCDGNFDDGSFLRLDYNIKCEGTTYELFVLYSVIMIFVFPVGVPLFYAFNLYHARAPPPPTPRRSP